MSAVIINTATGATTTRPLTADEQALVSADQQAIAARQAADAQTKADDDSDRSNRAALFRQCKQDYTLLTDTTTYPTLTQAQYRAMLAHVLRLLWLVIQVIERRGL